MVLLGYFLLFTLTYAQICSWNNTQNYEQIYLCQEKLNSTSIRIWLHLKIDNQWNLLFYYTFTLRIIDQHKIKLKDRVENRISDYAEINFNRQENRTINIQNLSPGLYEICANFFNNKTSQFYTRSSNSCLHIPWNIPLYENGQPNHSIHILFMILIIILLVSCAFCIYAVHTYCRSRKLILLPQIDQEENHDINERARFLVNQHFVDDINPFAVSVRKRMHQRYAHRFE